MINIDPEPLIHFACVLDRWAEVFASQTRNGWVDLNGPLIYSFLQIELPRQLQMCICLQRCLGLEGLLFCKITDMKTLLPVMESGAACVLSSRDIVNLECATGAEPIEFCAMAELVIRSIEMNTTEPLLRNFNQLTWRGQIAQLKFSVFEWFRS